MSKELLKKKEENSVNIKRRDFLKIGAAGTAVGALALASAPKDAAARALDKETQKAILKEHDDFPNEIRADYKPHNQWDTVHAHGFFPEALKAAGIQVDEDAESYGQNYIKHVNYIFNKDKKGYDQLAKATMSGGWALSNATTGPSPGAIPDFGLYTWKQKADKNPIALMDTDFIQKEKYQFKSKKEASAAIKRVAKLYGADLVGITKNDKRWNFAKFFNPIPPMGRQMFPAPPSPEAMKDMMENPWTPDKFVYGWEKYPFKPKTVIVLAFEMDYEGIAASPTEIGAAAAGEGYSQMAKSAYQLSTFFKTLGYQSTAAGNDMGLSVPYAIAAGLGEGSRMGLLVTYKYGPRVRLAKVYTDFDFVEYDKPKTFGVLEFCKRCMRCAEACPSKAVSSEVEPSFEPKEKDAWYNNKGVKKYYGNAKKCFQHWMENEADCGNCITSCPYNKPDFWHHRLVDGISKAMPGPVHSFMREMDIVFGYGDTYDEKAIDKFFDPKGKSYDGY